MKHFILLSVLLVSSFYAVAVDRNEAIRIADNFMFSSRQNILSDCEHQVLETDQLYIINYVFRSQAEVGFAVIGKNDSLPSPILAFSPSGRINLANVTIRKLLENYSKEIKEWSEGRMQLAMKDTVYYQRKKSVCLPLLKEISWHQKKPYNNEMPLVTKKEKYQVGCAAIAVGQIMKYYEHPCQGIGNSSYIQTNEKGEEHPLVVNYDSLHIDWSTIKNKYDPQESVRASKSVSQLLYHCALAAEVKLSPEVTTGMSDLLLWRFIKTSDIILPFRLYEKMNCRDRNCNSSLFGNWKRTVRYYVAGYHISLSAMGLQMTIFISTGGGEALWTVTSSYPLSGLKPISSIFLMM